MTYVVLLSESEEKSPKDVWRGLQSLNVGLKMDMKKAKVLGSGVKSCVFMNYRTRTLAST